MRAMSAPASVALPTDRPCALSFLLGDVPLHADSVSRRHANSGVFTSLAWCAVRPSACPGDEPDDQRHREADGQLTTLVELVVRGQVQHLDAEVEEDDTRDWIDARACVT